MIWRERWNKTTKICYPASFHSQGYSVLSSIASNKRREKKKGKKKDDEFWSSWRMRGTETEPKQVIFRKKPSLGKVKVTKDVKVGGWEWVGLLQPPNTLEMPLQGTGQCTSDQGYHLSIRTTLAWRKRQYMRLYTSSFRLGMMASRETRQHTALLCIISNQQELEQVLMEILG